MIIKKYSDLNNLIKETKFKIKSNKLCIIKSFLDKKVSKKLINLLKLSFDLRKDIRTSGPFIYGQKDYRRLDIGDSYVNPKFLRFVSFFEWNKNNKKLFELIQPILKFRNQLCGIVQKNDFTYHIKNQRSKKYVYCDLIRMIQYPSGGGFLSEHQDKSKYFPKNILNVLVPLSTKEKYKTKSNFSKGGLYYVVNKKRINIEKFIDVGDLIIHNQTITHGVNSIDPHKRLDLKNFTGRTTLNFSIGNFVKKS